MDENELLNQSFKLHVLHLVSRNVSKKIGLTSKVCKSCNNKIFLHEKCHLVLHKSKLFQDLALL